MKEVELARHVIAFLQGEGWTVYQEVVCHNRRADIVATKGPLVWIVETKTGLGLAVLEQAHEWRNYAHFRSVAYEHVRSSRGYRGRNFAGIIAMKLGIGILAVDYDGTLSHGYSQPPEFDRRCSALHILRRHLVVPQQTYAEAGNAHGHFWSPYKQTCDALREYTSAHDGCLFKEAMEAITHHYKKDSTARSSMAKWISLGKVKGLRLERDGKMLRIFVEK